MTERNPYSPPKSELVSEVRRGKFFQQSAGFIIATTCLAVGGIVGFVSRTVRPLIDGPIHYEAIAEMGFKMLVSILLLWVSIRSKAERPIQWLAIAILALWLGSTLGWSAAERGVWTDYLVVNAIYGLLTLAIAVAIARWLRKRKNARGYEQTPA